MEDITMLATINRRQFVPSIVDDLFNDNFWPVFERKTNFSTPAVNIAETEKEYSIEVAAPGLKKEDIKVDLEENMLTISSENKEEKEEKNEKYTRKEFTYNAFKRSFILPDNVNPEKIEAKHNNGILYITVPKEEIKKLSKNIKVA